MFENLYEDSIRYDDNLLQAACVLQAEFDLDAEEYARIKTTKPFREALAATATDYGVSKAALKKRLGEILD